MEDFMNRSHGGLMKGFKGLIFLEVLGGRI